MTKPTLTQLEEYAAKIGFPALDAAEFIDHYDSNGWKVGKTKMVSWQATVRTWKRHHAKWKSERKPQRGARPTTMPIAMRNRIINRLNERKQRIMRTFPDGDHPAWARQELAKIQQQLDKL